ncbi:hypothetical protein SCUP234_12798 [Seiridium cupressi]
MDLNLQDKLALFEQLQKLQYDEDDDEVIDAEEAKHRAESKAFTKLAVKRSGIKPRSTFGGFDIAPGILHRRTASDPIVKAAQPTSVAELEVIVIEDTPQPKKALPGQPQWLSRLQLATNTDGTPVPDSTKRCSSQPNRNFLQSQLQTLRSSPPLEDSPSTSMGKRKRPKKIVLAPEAQQCFQGLAFYYIPNDDVNPVRERRITRAQEYGAEWTQSLDDATHVIVDDNFTYAHIENILAGSSTSADKIIVNESYPLQCITSRKLLNPNQKQYQVSGCPQPLTAPEEAVEPSQESEKSLLLKPAKSRVRGGRGAPVATPPRSDASTQRSTQLSSGNVISESQLGSQSAAVAVIIGTRQAAKEPDPSETPNSKMIEAPDPSAEDELAQCIHFVKANPNADVDVEQSDAEGGDGPPSSVESIIASSPCPEGSDGVGDSSDDDRQPKRKRMSKEKGLEDGSWQDKFACMKGGTKHDESNNPNADTIAKLQEMCDWYTRNNEEWRVRGYRGAISTLRQQTTRIMTAKQAKGLPRIGDRIAYKIEEIVSTGRLRRLEEAHKEPDHEVRELFLKIYDVGLQRAEKWIKQGHRTLEDLLEKANLSRNQKIGIEHYDDLNTRIPRPEAEALGRCVRRAAHDIDPKVELLIGGSYRRGSDSSGDIDFIITKKGTTSSGDLGPFLDRLVAKLTKEGFLTVGLATSSSTNGNKWHGCCVLPREEFPGDQASYRPIWRRIDLLLVPETEFGAALIYFTGNDVFNRSIRLLANKKKMNLSHRGLFRDIVRVGGVKCNDGVLIEGRDEKKIFEALGVVWREPHQRWC